MDENLEKSVTKLYSLGVNICFEGDDADYISELHKAENPEGLLRKLEDNKRKILVREIQKTAKKEPHEIEKKTMYVGSMNPLELSQARDCYDFFKILLQNEPNYKAKANEFLLGLAVSEKMYKGVSSDLKKVEEEMRAYVLGNADTTKEFKILCDLKDDFISLGEYISYDRLNFINQFIFFLFSKLEGDRKTLIDKMINRKYPFTEDNMGEWKSLIKEY